MAETTRCYRTESEVRAIVATLAELAPTFTDIAYEGTDYGTGGHIIGFAINGAQLYATIAGDADYIASFDSAGAVMFEDAAQGYADLPADRPVDALAIVETALRLVNGGQVSS